MIASLPMYDLASLRPVTDAWWRGLAGHCSDLGLAPPKTLSRGGEFGAEWRDPALFFSQCCGFDLVFGAARGLQVVALPVYSAPGCSARLARYRSVLVVRDADPACSLRDLRGRVCAVNMHGSHSGYNALRYLIAPLACGQRFFAAITVSGSHAGSLALVAAGRADLAAVDCVSYALIARQHPEQIARLRVLTRSPAAPCLPFVTRADADPDLVAGLRAGLRAALADPQLTAVRARLLLAGCTLPPPAGYRRVLAMARGAERRGFPGLV